jgi:hypothetical protein
VVNGKQTRDAAAAKTGMERRTSPRLPPSAIPALKSISLSSGPEVVLINISRGGALLESDRRLRPSTKICLRLVTAEAVHQVWGRVLRSQVSRLAGGLHYQSAVAFDQELALLAAVTENTLVQTTSSTMEPPAQIAPPTEGVAATEQIPTAREIPASQEEPLGQSEEDSNDLPPGVLTLTASLLSSGPDLQQAFEINHW